MLSFRGKKQPAVDASALLREVQYAVSASVFLSETPAPDLANLYYTRDDVQVGNLVGTNQSEFFDFYKVRSLRAVAMSEQSMSSNNNSGSCDLDHGESSTHSKKSRYLSPFAKTNKSMDDSSKHELRVSPKQRVGRIFSTGGNGRKQSMSPIRTIGSASSNEIPSKSPVRKTVSTSRSSKSPSPPPERKNKKNPIRKTVSNREDVSRSARVLLESKKKTLPIRETVSIGDHLPPLKGLPKQADSSSSSSSSSSSDNDRLQVQTCCYTLKRPKNKYTSPEAAQNAALRLILEVKYLSRLDHPSILKVKGLPRGEEHVLTVLSQDALKASFMITESIVETLDCKMERWRCATGIEKDEAESFDFTSGMFRKKLQYAQEIASALQHLHERNIVLVNLNPKTVGFLQDGTLQLTDLSCCQEPRPGSTSSIDFGMTDTSATSRSGDDVNIEEEDLTRLGFTPTTGDKPLVSIAKANFKSLALMAADGCSVPRYLAPEVMVHEDITPKVDSYSWSLVVFELLTLSKPYAKYKAGKYLMKICVEGQRPNLAGYKLPTELQLLFYNTWRQTVRKRWSMDQIITAIPTPRRRAFRVSPAHMSPKANGTERNHCKIASSKIASFASHF